jgi:aminoglycoside phosphotransferase (APT) family kinase protein
MPIGEGHSNVTFLLRRDGVEFVLRRPPRGPLPPSTHGVLREARVLRAVGPTPARVPTVLAACDDLGVIGAPFYLMEKIEGHVVTSQLPAELDNVAQRRRIGEELSTPSRRSMRSTGRGSGWRASASRSGI